AALAKDPYSLYGLALLIRAQRIEDALGVAESIGRARPDLLKHAVEEFLQSASEVHFARNGRKVAIVQRFKALAVHAKNLPPTLPPGAAGPPYLKRLPDRVELFDEGEHEMIVAREKVERASDALRARAAWAPWSERGARSVSAPGFAELRAVAERFRNES